MIHLLHLWIVPSLVVIAGSLLFLISDNQIDQCVYGKNEYKHFHKNLG